MARANSGSKSRQPWQRPSPTSSCALASRSPQITHCGACTGSIAARHSVQTGMREMLSSGVRHNLQSEGKRTEKTFRRRVCTGAMRWARCPARCVRRVRSSVSPLLKMTLQPALAESWRKLEPLSPAPRVAEERLVGFSPAPKHRDKSVYGVQCAGANDWQGTWCEFIEILSNLVIVPSAART